MATINLTTGETKLFHAVFEQMNTMPEIDYDIVAQEVGIKYAKNARQSFRRVWDKVKGRVAAAANNGSDENIDDDVDAESSKKHVAVKKTAVAKKGVAKTTGPKKASAGGPKARAPRKTKKQKEEEAAAAAAPEQEENEDEDEEDNEDGKSHTPRASNSGKAPIKAAKSAPLVESAAPILSTTATAPKTSTSVAVSPTTPVAPVEPVAVPVAVHEPVVSMGSLGSESNSINDAAVEDVACDINDEYEAHIRQMPLADWLIWKAEVGYTFDLLGA